MRRGMLIKPKKPCLECGALDRIDDGTDTILHHESCSKHVSNILEARKEFLEGKDIGDRQ